jgi:hypothetical protein
MTRGGPSLLEFLKKRLYYAQNHLCGSDPSHREFVLDLFTRKLTENFAGRRLFFKRSSDEGRPSVRGALMMRLAFERLRGELV